MTLLLSEGHFEGKFDPHINPHHNKILLNCYVDADYGNWNLGDANDLQSVRSHAAYIITLGGLPVLWKSK